MDIIKKLFPLSFKAKDVVGLIIWLVVYLVLPTLIGIVASLVSGIPVLGWIMGIISWASGIYCFIGIVLLFLAFFKVIK